MAYARLQLPSNAPGTAWLNSNAAISAELTAEQTAELAQKVLLDQTHTEQTYKHDRRSKVVQIVHDDYRWVVKRYRTSGIISRAASLVRRSIAWRECRAAAKIAHLNLRVCQPLLLVAGGGIDRDEALVLPWIEGKSLHHFVKNAPSPNTPEATRQRAVVAEAVGRQVGRLIRAGWINRDHKATNLMIDAACLSGDEPVIIDPVGLRQRRGVTKVWQMLANLCTTTERPGLVTPREQLRALRAVLRTDASLLPNHPDRLRAAARAIKTCMSGDHSSG